MLRQLQMYGITVRH